MQIAEQAGADFVFHPSVEEMYQASALTFVEVDQMGAVLCGKYRPGHFRGVATVVAKLFNIVQPDRAYFGQKDAQQCAVIKRMTQDLEFGIEIVILPTVREADGLAMSSRNLYLSAEERTRALCLSRSLFGAKQMLRDGVRDAKSIVDFVRDGMAEVQIDYVELVDADTMQPVEHIEKPSVLAVAAFVGPARLIDNVVLNPK